MEERLCPRERVGLASFRENGPPPSPIRLEISNPFYSHSFPVFISSWKCLNIKYPSTAAIQIVISIEGFQKFSSGILRTQTGNTNTKGALTPPFLHLPHTISSLLLSRTNATFTRLRLLPQENARTPGPSQPHSRSLKFPPTSWCMVRACAGGSSTMWPLPRYEL